jgi:hypothetical protein
MLRRVLLTAVLVVTAVLAAPGSPAQARACPLDWACRWIYYSDATYTTVVGASDTSCSGDNQSWGRRTAYEMYTEAPC